MTPDDWHAAARPRRHVRLVWTRLNPSQQPVSTTRLNNPSQQPGSTTRLNNPAQQPGHATSPRPVPYACGRAWSHARGAIRRNSIPHGTGGAGDRIRKVVKLRPGGPPTTVQNMNQASVGRALDDDEGLDRGGALFGGDLEFDHDDGVGGLAGEEAAGAEGVAELVAEVGEGSFEGGSDG